MAIFKKTLTIEHAQWSQEAETLIARALQRAYLPGIRSQVESGEAQLFVVNDGGCMVAAFVLRIDEAHDRKDGVIVAAAGDCAGVSLTHSVLPIIERMFVNCDRIRIHTERAGLAKMLAKYHGYGAQEIVLTKELQ